MTPETEITAADGSTPTAASSIAILKKRSDFLRAARARKVVLPGLILQIRNRGDDDPTTRVGFTCSKKVGNAVARNRAKRRLREVARRVLPRVGKAGHDYVLIGRAGKTAAIPFESLCSDFEKALQ